MPHVGSHEINNMLLKSDVYILVMTEPTSEKSVCAGYTYYLPNRTEHSKNQLKRNKDTVNILIYRTCEIALVWSLHLT